MTAAALGPKCFQELAFKAFKNRKQWLCWSPAGLIDQFLIFLETKAAHFKTVTITVNEVNIYKINALIRIYFSKRFTAGLECVNWFRIGVNVSLVLKLERAAQVYINEQSGFLNALNTSSWKYFWSKSDSSDFENSPSFQISWTLSNVDHLFKDVRAQKLPTPRFF